VIYWVNIVGLGATLYWSWAYVAKARLVKDEAPPGLDAAVRRRIVIAQTLYACGLALCFINTYVSIAFIVVVQLNYALAPRLFGLSRL
jgi:uncharacterized membrane protein